MLSPAITMRHFCPIFGRLNKASEPELACFGQRNRKLTKQTAILDYSAAGKASKKANGREEGMVTATYPALLRIPFTYQFCRLLFIFFFFFQIPFAFRWLFVALPPTRYRSPASLQTIQLGKVVHRAATQPVVTLLHLMALLLLLTEPRCCCNKDNIEIRRRIG